METPARRVFSRPPDDDAELDAWAERFASALLGAGEQVADDPIAEGEQ
jgi:hypothetical protein